MSPNRTRGGRARGSATLLRRMGRSAMETAGTVGTMGTGELRGGAHCWSTSGGVARRADGERRKGE